LFTTVPAVGHLFPMVPLARAFQDGGHQVAVATAGDFASHVTGLGLTALPAGLDLAEMRAHVARATELRAAHQAISPEPMVWPGVGTSDPVLAGVRRFARLGAAMVDDLVDICATFRPDLVIHEEAEMAGPLAARLAGVPNVNHSWASPVISPAQTDHLDQELAPLWQERGLAPEPVGGRYRFLHLDTCPPSLQAARCSGVTRAQLLQPRGPETEVDTRPRWLDRLVGGRPVIYITLGTVPSLDSAPLFATVIEGLRDEALELVVTVSRHLDPAAFGPQPANVHIERYVPQECVLAVADVAVGHGGPGSTVGALAHGLPVLVLPPDPPIFARVAEAVVTAGVGRRCPPSGLTPETVQVEVDALLSQPQYRQAAQAVRAEIDGMPSAASVITVLKDLVASA